jgi:hypothetical protein
VEEDKDDAEKESDDTVKSGAHKKSHLSDSEEEEEEGKTRHDLPGSDGEEAQHKKRNKQSHVLSDSESDGEANEVSRKVSIGLLL